MSETPPSANRKPLLVVLGVLGLVAVGALAFTLGKDDDGGFEVSTVTTAPPDTDGTTPPTTEQPEVENPIKIVDQGFSNYTDSDGNPKVGYGYIVENTGADIVRDIDFDVTLHGAADKVVLEDDAVVGILRPGERIGLGDELGSELGGAAVERLDVVIPYLEEPVADPSTVPPGGFEIGNIHTEASVLFLDTTFTISTTYSTDEIFPIAYAIYRNSAGAIVGGASTTGLIAPGGVMAPEAKISTWSIFPDVAATEVYVDPGLIFS